MPSCPDQLRVFAYLTAERASLYRMIMRVFTQERDRFALHLRAGDLKMLIALAQPDLSLDDSTLTTALGQLCDWGNLEKHQDTSEVRTVQEFYQPRYLYQLTREGEEADRAITRYLSAILEKGELQAVALSDIRSLLAELIALNATIPLDGAKVFGSFSQLKVRFEELTARAQIFMSDLQRSIDFSDPNPNPDQDSNADGLLHYKDVLITYLQKFILELRISASDIAAKIQHIENGNLPQIIQAVTDHALSDAIVRAEEERERVTSEWLLRWRGLRSWFIGDHRHPPQAEVLRRKALSAIPRLLNAIDRINERRLSRTDRVADLRVLASWFADTDTDAQAHRLWVAAFGLFPSRHLSIDSQSLVDQEAHPIRPHTSWNHAPSLKISPRLRLTSRYGRRGSGSTVVDRTDAKSFLQAAVREEGEQMEAARLELLTKGPTRLSQIQTLSDRGFDLLLDLLGDALSRKGFNGLEDELTETLSSDGSLMIRLQPASGGKLAEIVTPSGMFTGPDHFFQILDASDPNGSLDELQPQFEVSL